MERKLQFYCKFNKSLLIQLGAQQKFIKLNLKLYTNQQELLPEIMLMYL